MGHYSEKWWYSTGALATNQRAVVFEQFDNVLAAIYADPGLTVPLPNPTTTDASGMLEFYAVDGVYWVFVGRVDAGDSELIRTGPTPTGPVLSVNGQLPDILGNVTVTSTDLGAQPLSTILAKGDIYAGTGAGATTRLPVGIDEYLLVADSTQPTGLNWRSHNTFVESVNGFQGIVTLTALDVEAQPLTTIQAKGDLYIGTANDATTNLPVGPDGYVLTADSGTTEGASWQPGGSGSGIPETIIDAKGDLIAGSAPDTAVRLGVGANGYVLTADSSATEGVSWQPGGSGGGIPETIIDAKGDIIAGSAPDTAVRVGVGTDGFVLTADSGATEGVSWQPASTGSGDVVGPASATDLAITRFDGVTGKLIQDSGVTLSDDGILNIPAQLGPFFDNAGDTYYDDNRKALTFANGVITNPIGQQTVILVHNNSGDVLGPGTAVYITGSVGTYPFAPTVAPAKADNAVTARCVGLCSDTIADGNDGFVVIDGLMVGYPTVGYNEGDYMYVSQTIAGIITNIRPNPPDYAVCVGVVAVSDLVHGAITVFRGEAAVDTSTGDVVGPASATDTALARYDGVTGKLIEDSGVTLSDDGILNIPGGVGPFPNVQGDLYVDDNSGALTYRNEFLASGVDRQTLLRVHNNSGGAISLGMPVYITGHINVYPYPVTIDRAQANTATTAKAVGITAHTIVDGADGYVIVEGLFAPFPTLGYNYGDYLYVSPTISGAFTTTKPSAPNHAVCVGQVGVVDIAHGSINVMRTEAMLGLGTANQVRGVNNAGTAEENKTLFGTAGRLTVTQGAGTVTFNVDTALSNAAIDKSTLLAKGSLISATAAATPVDVPVGANNQVLTADSTTAAGIKWAAPASAPVTSVNGFTGVVNLTALNVGATPITRITAATNGISGGGDGSVDVLFTPIYGTAANTIMQGNDSRVINAVQGPVSATDNAIVRFDLTTGKIIQNSVVPLSDTGVFQVPVAATPTAANGNLWYSSSGGNALNFQNQQFADVTQQIGRSTWIEVHNVSAVTITKGQAIYVSGNDATIPTITRARADAALTAQCAGIAVHDIENNSIGYVCVSGIVVNVDTTGFGNGDTLYLSATVAGTLTNVKPAAPNFVVKVGQTGMPASPTVGSIVVQPSAPVLGAGANGQIAIARSTTPSGYQALYPPSDAVFAGLGGFFPAGGVVVQRSTAAMVLNQMYLLPFYILTDINMNTICFEVTAAVTNAVVRLGVYSGMLATPLPNGAPLADFGPTAAATVGGKFPAVSLALPHGLYYLAMVGQIAAPNLRFGGGFSPYVFSSPFPVGVNAQWQNCYTQSGVAGALPPIGVTNTGSIAPICGFS